MSELKPCPFCGDENTYVAEESRGPWLFVSCPTCIASIGSPNGKKGAAAAWNRRADLAGLPEELVERLRSVAVPETDENEAELNCFESTAAELILRVIAWHEGRKS